MLREGKGRSVAETPARSCSNCGNELNPEDQFSPNCERPVHATATVPTPEADVSVPAPQQVEDRPVSSHAAHTIWQRTGADRTQRTDVGYVGGVLGSRGRRSHSGDAKRTRYESLNVCRGSVGFRHLQPQSTYG